MVDMPGNKNIGKVGRPVPPPGDVQKAPGAKSAGLGKPEGTKTFQQILESLESAAGKQD